MPTQFVMAPLHEPTALHDDASDDEAPHISPRASPTNAKAPPSFLGPLPSLLDDEEGEEDDSYDEEDSDEELDGLGSRAKREAKEENEEEEGDEEMDEFAHLIRRMIDLSGPTIEPSSPLSPRGSAPPGRTHVRSSSLYGEPITADNAEDRIKQALSEWRQVKDDSGSAAPSVPSSPSSSSCSEEERSEHKKRRRVTLPSALIPGKSSRAPKSPRECSEEMAGPPPLTPSEWYKNWLVDLDDLDPDSDEEDDAPLAKPDRPHSTVLSSPRSMPEPLSASHAASLPNVRSPDASSREITPLCSPRGLGASSLRQASKLEREESKEEEPEEEEEGPREIKREVSLTLDPALAFKSPSRSSRSPRSPRSSRTRGLHPAKMHSPRTSLEAMTPPRSEEPDSALEEMAPLALPEDLPPAPRSRFSFLSPRSKRATATPTSPRDAPESPRAEGGALVEKGRQSLTGSLTRTLSKSVRDNLVPNDRYGDVWKMVTTYCKDWEDSPQDIATFFFCLAAFTKPPTGRRSAVFDEKLILSAYHFSQFAFAAYKPSESGVMHRLKFLTPDSFIAGQWDANILRQSPGWYMVVDHDQRNVVLALRGTKVLGDILTDLAAKYVPWKGGYVHQGFLKAMRAVERQVLPLLKEQLFRFPGYHPRVVGHSMGAAVAALLCIKWTRKYPDWHTEGFGFATPCCVSADLSKESEAFFTTFVHQFDAVARLSMGSIQDLHNGMRQFVARVGQNHNSLAILHAMQYMATGKMTPRIQGIADQIDKVITENIALQLSHTEHPSHLFPAGRTYQLWREKRGHDFHTWQMYQSDLSDYGRLWFSPSMLKDHVSAGYSGAFENMLSISVSEQQIWLNLDKTRREDVRDYWASRPCGDVFDPDFNWGPALEDMRRPSKHRRKALKAGLIRPFLLLVSMSPRRRAALSVMMGASLADIWWYREFDSHREAWHILTYHLKGLQPRSDSILRKINPLAHASDWWMILASCGYKVKGTQSRYISSDVKKLLRNKKKSFHASIKRCREPHNQKMHVWEETIHLLLMSLTDPDIKDSAEILRQSDPEAADLDKAKEKAQQEQYQQEHSQYRHHPVYVETVKILRERGYTLDMLIHRLAVQRAQASISKKANEIYAYGDVMRKRDERWRLKGALGLAGLSVISGVILLTIPAAIATMPPLLILPLGLGAVVAAFALKSTPGGLISVVAGCLEQRLALCYHGIQVDDFY